MSSQRSSKPHLRQTVSPPDQLSVECDHFLFAEEYLSGPIWQFSDTVHQSTEGELEIAGLVEPDVGSV